MKRLKYSPALNKLDQAAKEHNLNYNNLNITIEEADEQFLEDTRGTGFVGRLMRAAIRAKRALGLDNYFRGDIDHDHLSAIDSIHAIQNMDTGETSGQNISEGGEGNGWTATVIGKVLPCPSNNFVQGHCYNRTFKNMIKPTDMNNVKSTFTKYEGINTSTKMELINSVGHYAWAQMESADYIMPYFLTMWVMPPKVEVTIRYAT